MLEPVRLNAVCQLGGDWPDGRDRCACWRSPRAAAREVWYHKIPGTYDALSQAFVIGNSATSSGDYSQGSGYKPSPSVPAPRYRAI